MLLLLLPADELGEGAAVAVVLLEGGAHEGGAQAVAQAASGLGGRGQGLCLGEALVFGEAAVEKLPEIALGQLLFSLSV